MVSVYGTQIFSVNLVMNLFLLAGTIQPNMAPYIKDAAQMMFAQQHGVTWLRIQNVGLVYDDAYIYISYTLLDKAPPIGIYTTFIWDVSGEKHYENTPIQLYWKFYHQKKWKFSDKKFWYFSYFCTKHRLWVLVRTASMRRF